MELTYTQLTTRYKKPTIKFLCDILTGYHRKSEYIKGFSGVSMPKHILGSKYSTIYRPSKNRSKTSLHEFIDRVNVDFSDFYQREGDLSILRELLILKVIERDIYIKGEKTFYYRIINDDIENQLIKLLESKVIAKDIKDSNSKIIIGDLENIPVEINESLIKSVQEQIIPIPLVPLARRNRLSKDIRKKLASCTNYADKDNKDKLFLVPDIKLSYTGRLYNIGNFNPQYIKTGDKKEYYTNLSDSVGYNDYKNYDIQSSQLTLLNKLCENIGMDKKLYKESLEHIVDKKFYQNIALKFNLQINTIKKCALSLVFGGSVRGSVYRFIENDENMKDRSVELILNNFLKEMEILMDLLKLIKIKLSQYLEDNNFEYCDNGVTKIKYSSIIKNRININKILVFYLQGMESFYIYNLINICKQKDVKVISYEFDGVVTLGEITEEMKMIAIEKSGINVNLIEKQFNIPHNP